MERGMRRVFILQGLSSSETHFCRSLAADSKGNIYIADTWNFLTRTLSLDGTVSTIAGSGVQGHKDGKAEEAQFGKCFGIAVGEDGTLYFSDWTHHVIRRISGGSVTT